MIVDVLWGFMGEGFWVPLYFMGVWAPLYFVGEGFGCLYVYGWIPVKVFGVFVFGGGMGSIPLDVGGKFRSIGWMASVGSESPSECRHL